MLYLANPSRQPHVFAFREPVNGLVQYLTIPDGGQECIGHGWSPEQTAKVIAQVQSNGGRPVDEVHRTMTKFNGLLYSDIAQITEDEIVIANEADELTRDERARSEAVKASLGFDRAVRKGEGKRPPVRTTETTVQEELPRGSRKRDAVNFNLTVDPEGRNDVKLPV